MTPEIRVDKNSFAPSIKSSAKRLVPSRFVTHPVIYFVVKIFVAMNHAENMNSLYSLRFPRKKSAVRGTGQKFSSSSENREVYSNIPT